MQSYDQSYVGTKYRFSDERGTYRLSDLTASGTRNGESGKPWRGFDPTPIGRHWGIPKAILIEIGADDLSGTGAKLDALDEANFIYWTPGRPGSPGFPQLKRYIQDGQQIQSVIDDIPPVNSMAKERLGYPTQKPVALLERIISASSNPGDIVLDPFCGCGTTVHAAQKLDRQWIGIDVTHLAISLIERRLRDAFGRGAEFVTIGVPKDIEAARDLATRDKHEFEKWAIALVPDAQPFRGGRKGADTGIDGVVFLRTGKNKTDRAIVEVKGGGISVDQVHKLKSVIGREKALIGLFVTLNPPTRQMVAEAASAGFVEIDMGTGTQRFPRIQILTIEGLLSFREFPRLPIIDSTAFRKAPAEKSDKQAGFVF